MALLLQPLLCLPRAGREGVLNGMSLAHCGPWLTWLLPAKGHNYGRREQHVHVSLDNTTSEREFAP